MSYFVAVGTTKRNLFSLFWFFLESLGPLEVSLSDVGTTSLEIVWGPVAGNFTGYNLTYVSPDLVSISVSLDPILERYLLTNLQPGTVYVVLLRQIGGPLFFTGEVVTSELPLGIKLFCFCVKMDIRKRQNVTYSCLVLSMHQ